MRWQHRPLLELEQGRNCTSQPILLLQTAARLAKAVRRERPPEQGEEDGLGRDLRHGAGRGREEVKVCSQSCCLVPVSVPQQAAPCFGDAHTAAVLLPPPSLQSLSATAFWGSLSAISMPPPRWGKEWGQPSLLSAQSPTGSRGTQQGEEMRCFRKDSTANLASIPHCGHLLETERHRRGSNISPGTRCPAQHNQLPMDCAGTGSAFGTCICQRALKKCKDSKFGHRTTFSLTK